jgi:hypothetical protein
MCLAWYSQGILGATVFVEMQWAIVDGVRQKPSPGLTGACPGCGGEVRAKCGKQVTWHWAHLAAECDSWSESESEWHLKWKYRFPKEMQEVSMGAHRADVKGAAAVLEVQASPIDVDMVAERERFYGEMLWMLKGEDFVERFEVRYALGGVYRFIWKKPRKGWGLSARRVLIDLPYGIFEITNIMNPRSTPFVGSGFFLSPAKLYESVCGSDLFVDGEAQRWRADAEALLVKRSKFEKVLDAMYKVIEEWSKYRLFDLRLRRDQFINLHRIDHLPSWLDGVNYSVRNFQIKVWGELCHYEEEVSRWEGYIAELQEFCQEQGRLAKQQLREYEESWRKAESKSIANSLERQRELDEAARISSEKQKEVRRLQQLKAEKEERLRKAAIFSVELLAQSQALAAEWKRGDIVSEIQLIRPRPATVYGAWSTHDLQGLLASLRAARKRLGGAEWSRLAGVK